jgi:hypothetical protein
MMADFSAKCKGSSISRAVLVKPSCSFFLACGKTTLRPSVTLEASVGGKMGKAVKAG